MSIALIRGSVLVNCRLSTFIERRLPSRRTWTQCQTPSQRRFFVKLVRTLNGWPRTTARAISYTIIELRRVNHLNKFTCRFWISIVKLDSGNESPIHKIKPSWANVCIWKFTVNVSWILKLGSKQKKNLFFFPINERFLLTKKCIGSSIKLYTFNRIEMIYGWWIVVIEMIHYVFVIFLYLINNLHLE